MSIDDFADLSRFLLGIPLAELGIQDLPPDLVPFYFSILDGNDEFTSLLNAWQQEFAGLSPDQQAALLESNINGNTALWRAAQKLIMLWYTAVWDSRSTDQALNSPDPSQSYPFALVWFLSRSHPRSVTKSFGYWQYPPTEEQS